MKPIAAEDRKVANINTGTYEPFLSDNGTPDGDVLQVNPNNKRGYGFHVYRMEPGQTTVAHRHDGDEEFLVLEGELFDHDGYRYGPGDLVWLRDGTEHCSTSPGGCLLAVYLPGTGAVGTE
ncbi:MAG: cupin domain-containing protein [Pseudomonadota bacterium]